MKNKAGLVLLIALMLLVTGCGKQTASAYISDGTAGTTAIIRLNGGWSVDFAGDCFSLYDGEITENADCKAIGIVIDESIFKDYMKEAQESDTYKTVDDAVYYENEDGAVFLRIVNGEACFMLTVRDPGDAEEVYERVSFAIVD